MKKPVPLEVYLAFNATKEAQKVLMDNGIKPARDHKELVRKLNAFIVQGKEDALKQLAEIHPDKDLILEFAKKSENKSGACGCSHADGGGDSSKEGKTEDHFKKFMESIKPHAPTILVGAFILTGLIVLVKKA